MFVFYCFLYFMVWMRVFHSFCFENQIAFQDLAHCMVMNDSSVQTLNQRAGRDTPAIQFRPNIIVFSPKPFDEVGVAFI